MSMEMFKFLAQETYAINMAASECNVESLKQMAGNVGEHKIAKLVKGKVVNREFDVVAFEQTILSNGIVVETGDRIEVKTAVIQTNGKCIAYSLSGKEGNCDFIALVDMTRGPYDIRMAIIPSDIFFQESFFNKKNGEKERFSWDGKYQIKRPNSGCATNTNLFLEHEVVDETVS